MRVPGGPLGIGIPPPDLSTSIGCGREAPVRSCAGACIQIDLENLGRTDLVDCCPVVESGFGERIGVACRSRSRQSARRAGKRRSLDQIATAIAIAVHESLRGLGRIEAVNDVLLDIEIDFLVVGARAIRLARGVDQFLVEAGGREVAVIVSVGVIGIVVARVHVVPHQFKTAAEIGTGVFVGAVADGSEVPGRRGSHAVGDLNHNLRGIAVIARKIPRDQVIVPLVPRLHVGGSERFRRVYILNEWRIPAEIPGFAFDSVRTRLRRSGDCNRANVDPLESRKFEAAIGGVLQIGR